MSKKNKKKRRQYKYNQTQFIDILCSGCNLCGEYVDPEFCFGQCYKNSPVSFVNNIYKSVTAMREWPFHEEFHDRGSSGIRTIQNELRVFKKNFCNKGCCTPKTSKKYEDQCEHIHVCMAKLRLQIKGSTDTKGMVTSHVVRKKKKSKQNQKRVVIQPYPTFVMSGSAAFKARVRRILYGKANTVEDNKQTGNQGLPCESTAGDNE